MQANAHRNGGCVRLGWRQSLDGPTSVSARSLKRPSPGRLCSECCGRVRTAVRSLSYVDHSGLGVLAEGGTTAFAVALNIVES